MNRERTAKQPCRPRARPTGGPDPCESSEIALVRVVAWQIYARLPKYAAVEMTDLLQAGYVGLLRARQAYKDDKAVLFLVYARFRIRGEILDMLRRLDNAPRSLRRWQRAIEIGSRELTARLQRIPTDDEISESLGIELEVIRRNRQALWTVNLETEPIRESGDERKTKEWAAAPDRNPDVIHERKEWLQVLMDCVVSLPARPRQVIMLYYRQNLTMKQIGALLSVNESRISQIHKAALKSMGEGLKSAGITTGPGYQK